ncbi:MAG: dihydroorotase [Bacteroidaceae bacterium]|nr:dihydroorotase [Bacteroidaceae bacterium]MBQ2809240.1 dihydroorotase [Bacteroidaceae bacterium]
MRILISNPTIVNNGEQFQGSIVVNKGKITEILRGNALPRTACDEIVEATGLYLIPGVIDDHVHFREPGLTQKATITTESRAAAAGGVTSFMEMPNTVPQTTTLKALKEKFAIAAKDSAINYSFYFGATNKNVDCFSKLNRNKVCGIKLFMGSSTGNMLVDKAAELEKIFAEATRLDMPVAVHCEDSNIITRNAQRVKEEAGEDAGVEYHPAIRSAEACYRSTKSAVELAMKHGTRLNVMHISTAKELELLSSAPLQVKRITAEVTPAHLTFCDKDYTRLGTRIKCNPAIKSIEDREALRKAVADGRIDVVGTDHAPHLPKDKEGGALKAASGMPSIQFSLLAMLRLADEGAFTLETLVEKMCHAPARIYNVEKRGFIEKGYHADFVLLNPDRAHTVTADDIMSKCGWSPFEGETFEWAVEQTWVNGECVYRNGRINEEVRGKSLKFNR